MTTKKKKASQSTKTPIAASGPIIRVHWTLEDYANLLRIQPRLGDPKLHHPDTLTEVLREAQKQLPKDRQMTNASVRQRVTQNHEKVIAAIREAEAAAAAVKKPAPVAKAAPAEPATTPKALVVSPAMEAVNAVRWTEHEYALVAREVAEHLRKGREPATVDFVDYVVRAQSKVLPRHRWRQRTGLTQACYKGGERGLVERLRHGMRTQAGLHFTSATPPEPIMTAPQTPPVPQPQAAPVQAAAAPAAPAAPVAAPSATAPSVSPLTSSVAEEALVALVRNAFRAGISVLVQAMAEHSVSVLRDEMVSMIDATVRKSVSDVVGGPSEPVAQAEGQSANDTNGHVNGHINGAKPASPPISIEKPRVDVIGLLNGQANVVRRAMSNVFNLRFVSSDDAERQRTSADNVVICTKFVQHSAQEKAKANGAKVLYANGAAQSVIEQLQALHTVRGVQAVRAAQH